MHVYKCCSSIASPSEMQGESAPLRNRTKTLTLLLNLPSSQVSCNKIEYEELTTSQLQHNSPRRSRRSLRQRKELCLELGKHIRHASQSGFIGRSLFIKLFTQSNDSGFGHGGESCELVISFGDALLKLLLLCQQGLKLVGN